MLTSWPAARPTLALLQLLLGSADAPFSCRLLLGILDPADELVTGQRGDVFPGIEGRGVSHQRLTQVRRKVMDHPTGHLSTGHSGHRSGRNERELTATNVGPVIR